MQIRKPVVLDPVTDAHFTGFDDVLTVSSNKNGHFKVEGSYRTWTPSEKLHFGLVLHNSCTNVSTKLRLPEFSEGVTERGTDNCGNPGRVRLPRRRREESLYLGSRFEQPRASRNCLVFSYL